MPKTPDILDPPAQSPTDSVARAVLKGDPWPKVKGNNGLPCWDTPWGRAYTFDCPPERAPLTASEVQALPDGSRILVLWGGGNGPHEYTLRDGRTFYEGEPPNRGSRLGGLIGSWKLVGDKNYQDKVWLVALPEVAE